MMENVENTVRDAYRSIAALSEGLFKDSGSRFIARAYPVESEMQVKEIVSGLKKEYHDARHHCYAYRLGYKGDIYRVNDDGEPSSSAGRPILGQIDSLGLSDVLVAVVRYFGGIKLGIPGLIRAYRISAADALGKAQVITKVASRCFRLEFSYEVMNDIMRAVKGMGIESCRPECGNVCSLVVRVRLSAVQPFIGRVSGIPGCTVTYV